MGLSMGSKSHCEIKAAPSFLSWWKERGWRLAFIVLVGLGLWLALRWAASPSRPPTTVPTLQSFLADGGGGAFEVGGIYAPQEYFRLTQRDPAALGLDPSRELIFFLLIDNHEQQLPSATTWWDAVSLRINGEGDYHPQKQRLVMDSEHHQTVVLAFPPKGVARKPPVAGGQNLLTLLVPDLGDGGARTLEWRLSPSTDISPIPQHGFLSPSLGAFLPLLAGLLVAFSPCLIHMSTYYLPLFSTVAGQRETRVSTKGKLALVAGLFTLGFVIPYTVAGVLVGYVGQFAKTSLLGSASELLSLAAGVMVLYFGLQVAGVFSISFLARLSLPLPLPGRGRTSYLASWFLGLNLAVGCLGCIGGSLFAALLLYSTAVGSPVEGGAVLFLFALAANAPFFIAAVTAGRFQLGKLIPPSVVRYAPVLSGGVLIALGLLILSGNESLIEDTLIQALGIGV